MKKLPISLRKLYYRIINSIAFYPSLLTIFFMGFALFVMSIEFNELVMSVKPNFDALLVHDADNARLILGTIVGSVFSLMVFSFSMVMVVLNRATATLSPRVLPGLISNKFHQIVLGYYLGTIIFSLLLIVNINAPDAEFTVPSLGILLSILMTITCLGLFVYFIHSISQQIQVDNILNDIYKKTIREIEKSSSTDSKKHTISDNVWYDCIYAYDSGYLKNIEFDRLKKWCEETGIQIKMCASHGDFILKGESFFQTSKKLSDEHLDSLFKCFILYVEEHVSDHYAFGFKQISEIAIKALSPGINDPGTAIRAIDLLTDLYLKRIDNEERHCVTNEQDEVIIWLKPITIHELILRTLVPIGNYGNQDILVFLRMMLGLEKIFRLTKNDRYFDELYGFLLSLVKSSNQYFNSDMDRKTINKQIVALNNVLPKNKNIKKIKKSFFQKG